MLIQPTALRDFVTELFTRAGATGMVAGEVAEHLVEANLKGHDSHGVGMIPAYVGNIKVGHLDVQAHASVIRDSGAVLLVDGHHGFGQVVGREATDIAIARVKDTGVVCLGLRNAHHLGRIGSYGERCGRAGLVSVHFVNVVGHEPRVSPWGGRERRMTTNPFCCAVPRDGDEPVVLDMATSAIALGKVRVACRAIQNGSHAPRANRAAFQSTRTPGPTSLKPPVTRDCPMRKLRGSRMFEVALKQRAQPAEKKRL
jgi:uncharacterized oxidoreductase